MEVYVQAQKDVEPYEKLVLRNGFRMQLIPRLGEKIHKRSRKEQERSKVNRKIQAWYIWKIES